MQQVESVTDNNTEIKDRTGKLHPIIWINFVPRASGWPLGMFVLYTVYFDIGLSTWLAILITVQAFGWPLIALLISKRSSNPKKTETRLILLDMFFTGCYQPLLFFQPWAVVATTSISLMGIMAINGVKAYFMGIGFMILGAGIVTLITGFHFEPDSSPFTIGASVMGIFIFTAVMSFVTYKRSSRLIHIKKQQRELNEKLYRMYELIKTASSSLKLLEIVERITPELKEIFKFDTIFILKYNPDNNTLKYHRTISEVVDKNTQDNLKMLEIDLHKESSFVKAVLDRQDMVYIPDFLHEIIMTPTELGWFELTPFYSVLMLPISNEGNVTGIIGFQSHEKKFYLSEVDLQEVRRYASQISLMINNSLLYEESRAAEKTIKLKNESLEQAYKEIQSQRDEVMQTRDNLQKALDDLKSLQIQLIQQEKLASLGQLTAGIAHEIKNPLNFVNNFSEVSLEMVEEAQELIPKLNDDPEATEELKDILEDISLNLKKVHEHGSRADRIVKSMLEHSRGGSGKKEMLHLNGLIKEYVNLSFHGMRAGKKSINVDIDLQLDESIKEVELVAEDFSRVILNISNNAFDAMHSKINDANTPAGYKPKLTVRSRQVAKNVPKQSKSSISPGYEDSRKNYDFSETLFSGAIPEKETPLNALKTIHIDIEDNGPGIPDDIKDKILQPFFTTKKGTEGTGLGLSITHDIIKAHGGNLEIESTPEGTIFKISLPQQS